MEPAIKKLGGGGETIWLEKLRGGPSEGEKLFYLPCTSIIKQQQHMRAQKMSLYSLFRPKNIP